MLQEVQWELKPGGDPINVHFNFNEATGAIDDFKVVVPGP